jgi:hypothetical protein
MSEFDKEIEDNEKELKDIQSKIDALGVKYQTLKKRGKLTYEIKRDIANKRLTYKNILKQKKQENDELLLKQLNELAAQDEVIKQPENLYNREQEYERKTGKKYNPLLDTIEVEDAISRAEEEQNRIKAQQQQEKNLSELEQYYEGTTRKKYNPLVIDDDDNDNIDMSVPTPPLVAPSPPLYTSNMSRNTPSQTLTPIEIDANPLVNNKTRKNRNTPEEIEMTEFSRNPIKIDSNPDVKNKTRKNRNTPEEIEMKEFSRSPIINTKNLGFSESIKRKKEDQKKSNTISQNICEYIFINGSKVNKKFYCPSQFPKLTRIKSITVSNKKGGKRKTRKYSKRKIYK